MHSNCKYVNSRPAHLSLYHLITFIMFSADPNGHAVYGVGLRPLACWDSISVGGMDVSLL